MILDKLKIDNRENLLEFLVLDSRFEYALKRTNFTKTPKGYPEANWEKFISKNKKKFDPLKSEHLKMYVDYLLNFPSKKEVIENGDLFFVQDPNTHKGPVLCRLYHCIRITRNNLFHGGKFMNGPEPDLSRNKDLIENCIVVLNEILLLDKKVQSMFWELE